MFGKKKDFSVKPRKAGNFDFTEKSQGESFSARVRKNLFFNFFLTLIRSLNPDAYPRLSSRKLRQGFSYLFWLILFSLIISLAIMIPKVSSFSGSVESALSGFSSLSISADAKSPVLLDFGLRAKFDPLFTLAAPKPQPSNTSNSSAANQTANTTAVMSLDSDFVVSSSGIYRKPLPCMLWQAACLLYPSEDRIVRIGGDGFFDVLKYKAEYSRIIGTAIILMMPSLLIILLIFYFIKYTVLMLVMSLLMYLSARALRHKLSYARVLSTSLYACTAMVLLQILNIPLHFLSGVLVYLPFALYLLFFAIGIILQESDLF